MIHNDAKPYYRRFVYNGWKILTALEPKKFYIKWRKHPDGVWPCLMEKKLGFEFIKESLPLWKTK